MLDSSNLRKRSAAPGTGWWARTASYPRSSRRGRDACGGAGPLGIMFRALGGEAGVQLAGAESRKSGHRLRWRQQLGLGDESSIMPGRDGATVFLPDRIELFPDAWTTRRSIAGSPPGSPVPVVTARETDPLRPMLSPCACPRHRSKKYRHDCPACIRPSRAAGCRAWRKRARRRPLPRVEQAVEAHRADAARWRARRRKAAAGRP